MYVHCDVTLENVVICIRIHIDGSLMVGYILTKLHFDLRDTVIRALHN